MSPCPAPCPSPRGQSLAGSWAEAVTNVVAGFLLAVLVQLGGYPLLGIHTTMAQNGVIALIFTVLSLLRAFASRRLFVGLERNRARERAERARSLERRLSSGRL